MKKSSNPEKTYHHGNLELALVDAAIKAVREDGFETFSLRVAAQQTGVTPGAVYKHFASKGALLAAVATKGFEQMGKRVAEAQAQASPNKRFAAIGLAYVSFAVDEPNLFSLMFGPSGPDAPRDSITSPRGSAFEALRNAIAEAQGISDDQVTASHLALAWASAHGAARLVTDGLWQRDDPRIEMTINAVVAAITGAK